jgi:UDP-N-acetylglucosamine diphosphorylase / glucose-1-phosphate thymidylyltransferase / UDP-N-acetylgalactosamine diphosphorylase / glucosamine-1-phosphate N-acetyltransferase / galactosamine-1-phosphate N-acetyltransferase
MIVPMSTTNSRWGMTLSDLFSAEMEPELHNWIKRFASLDDLFSALPQLYANLRAQNIQGTVEDGAVIIGAVHIGAGSIVRGQAIIRGPVIVGPECAIHSHVEIQAGCFIGSRCVIEHSSSIAESLIMDDVSIMAGAYIQRSVIGSGCVVGPNATLGTDQMEGVSGASSPIRSKRGAVLGDGVAIGANSTIRRGAIVGSRTIVGENVLAQGLYESDQTVMLSQALEIKIRK